MNETNETPATPLRVLPPREIIEELPQKGIDLGPNIHADLGHWVRMQDEDVVEMYESMFKWAEDEELDNLDHSRLCYDIHDAEWYAEKFPGFIDSFYPLLAECAKEENKVQDFRPPPLRIDTNTTKTLTFS